VTIADCGLGTADLYDCGLQIEIAECRLRLAIEIDDWAIEIDDWAIEIDDCRLQLRFTIADCRLQYGRD
jgi:hypothetical protein